MWPARWRQWEWSISMYQNRTSCTDAGILCSLEEDKSFVPSLSYTNTTVILYYSRWYAIFKRFPSSTVFCPAFSFSLLLSISGPVIVSVAELCLLLQGKILEVIKFIYVCAFFFLPIPLYIAFRLDFWSLKFLGLSFCLWIKLLLE